MNFYKKKLLLILFCSIVVSCNAFDPIDYIFSWLTTTIPSEPKVTKRTFDPSVINSKKIDITGIPNIKFEDSGPEVRYYNGKTWKELLSSKKGLPPTFSKRKKEEKPKIKEPSLKKTVQRKLSNKDLEELLFTPKPEKHATLSEEGVPFEYTGKIQLHKRVEDWFLNPERALEKQGYIRGTKYSIGYKCNLLDRYGKDIIIQNHRFPQSIDTRILFDPIYGSIEKKLEKDTYQIVNPGYIKRKSGIIEFGQYEYTFNKVQNTRIIFHRFFRPMTRNEIIAKFTNKDGWSKPVSEGVPSYKIKNISELEWKSPKEKEGWIIDDHSLHTYTIIAKEDEFIEYGIQKKNYNK